MNESPDMLRQTASASQSDTDHAVVFHNVSFAYPGASGEVLKNIDFAVDHGESVGIIGGTGSGKSSLVGLIPRFYDVTAVG